MKKYFHWESVWCIYNETEKLTNIIGYSCIQHIDNPKVKFAYFKAYYLPLWSDDIVLVQQGEIRWDGLITGENTKKLLHRGIDDLLSSIYLQYCVYYIAQKHLFERKLEEKYDQIQLAGITESPLIYRILYHDPCATFYMLGTLSDEMWEKCKYIKEELTEMSNEALNNMEKSDKSDT